MIGSWDEVRGTNESLQFNADGTVLMPIPGKNHECVHHFPCTTHIRFNCTAQGTPRRHQVWKVEQTSDRLLINDNHEVSNYNRK